MQVQHAAMLLQIDLEVHVRSDLDVGAVGTLASLGSQGTHSQNCNRDLLSKFMEPDIAKSYIFMMPLNSSTEVRHVKLVDRLMPHALVAN